MLVGEDAVRPSISDAANVKQSTTSLFQHQPITTFDSSFFFTLEQRGSVCSIIISNLLNYETHYVFSVS